MHPLIHRSLLLLLLLAAPLLAQSPHPHGSSEAVFEQQVLPLVLAAGREALVDHPHLDAEGLERTLREDILQQGPYSKAILQELGGLDRLSRNQVIALCFVAGLAAGFLLM